MAYRTEAGGVSGHLLRDNMSCQQQIGCVQVHAAPKRCLQAQRLQAFVCSPVPVAEQLLVQTCFRAVLTMGSLAAVATATSFPNDALPKFCVHCLYRSSPCPAPCKQVTHCESVSSL